MLKFVPCCAAAGADADYGYYVDAAEVPSTPASMSAGSAVIPAQSSDLLPDREFTPDLGVCYHEAAHSAHLHARGYRIARAQVGRRNFIERAPGEGARMTSLEQIEAALAGEVGGNYATVHQIRRMIDEEINTAIARVATGRHGNCDHCLAGIFTRHIASFSANPDDPAVIRAIWRRAECNVIEMLTSRQAYLGIRSLGEMLRNENEMTGEAVHRIVEPYIEFGSQGSENDRQVN